MNFQVSTCETTCNRSTSVTDGNKAIAGTILGLHFRFRYSTSKYMLEVGGVLTCCRYECEKGQATIGYTKEKGCWS